MATRGIDLIAELESIDTLADRGNNAGNIAVKSGRKFGVKAHILPEKHVVDRVQARGFHLDGDLPRGRLRDRNFSRIQAGFRSVASREIYFHDLFSPF
jgi:hypothetical protein